jgi:hypothetical protein
MSDSPPTISACRPQPLKTDEPARPGLSALEQPYRVVIDSPGGAPDHRRAGVGSRSRAERARLADAISIGYFKCWTMEVSMLILLIVLLVLWLILTIVGFAIKGLLWLAIVGIVLLVGTAAIGAVRRKALRR